MTPVERFLLEWEKFLAGDHDALAANTAEGAVLHSPVLFRPLTGKDTVLHYLAAAAISFPGTNATGPSDPGRPDWDGRFRYVRRVVGDHDAVLEFETTIDGKYVNGVDMFTVDDDAHLVDMKVMVRPLQAVEAVRNRMVAALDSLKPS